MSCAGEVYALPWSRRLALGLGYKYLRTHNVR